MNIFYNANCFPLLIFFSPAWFLGHGVALFAGICPQGLFQYDALHIVDEELEVFCRILCKWQLEGIYLLFINGGGN